ncbi:hypothetical protein HDV05_001223 [Chytridiales sp. JEL 0842]|nr:hypothetical protein HDV05_001223 [Chytridiales sp. JEL 0842]
MGTNCNQFTFGWAPGAGIVNYPSVAGMPIGTGTNALRYFALQVHYNNPDRDAGVVDNSGMSFSYTPTLRPNDIGILILGQQGISIPGDFPDSTVLAPNVCPGQCTSKLPAPVTMISSAAHMHFLGKNLTTRHIRGDTELAPVLNRTYYDFNYQGAQKISKETGTNILNPGDTLVTTCAYNPTLGVRRRPTGFGESSESEMCFNFITYYPRLPTLDFCVSRGPATLCTTRRKLTEVGLGRLEDGNATAANVNLTAIGRLLTDGDVVLNAALPSFKPYAPQCVATVVEQKKSLGFKTVGLGWRLMSTLMVVMCGWMITMV